MNSKIILFSAILSLGLGKTTFSAGIFKEITCSNSNVRFSLNCRDFVPRLKVERKNRDGIFVTTYLSEHQVGNTTSSGCGGRVDDQYLFDAEADGEKGSFQIFGTRLDGKILDETLMKNAVISRNTTPAEHLQILFSNSHRKSVLDSLDSKTLKKLEKKNSQFVRKVRQLETDNRHERITIKDPEKNCKIH